MSAICSCPTNELGASDEDFQPLAELIAAGETRAALELLHELVPETHLPSTTIRLVAQRRAEAQALVATR